MLITAGGQHVVPSVLEDKVREHWLIAECVVAGERRPYPAALITLDEAAFARWKQRHGRPARPSVSCLRLGVCRRVIGPRWAALPAVHRWRLHHRDQVTVG